MERRHFSLSKSSTLPSDYCKMVADVFKNHFEDGLKIYEKIHKNSGFVASGNIFTDEVIVAVSLLSEGKLAATTVYASVDFDPKASSPTAEDLLSACVDAIATTYSSLLDPETPEIISNLAEENLSALKDVPYDWGKVEANQRQVFVKIDKSNPLLDRMTDEWLRKNDPQFEDHIKEEQEETEKLFFTGPKNLKKSH